MIARSADNYSGATGNPERMHCMRVRPAGATIEKGNLPDPDELSLTFCPVHALSMGSNEWVEMAWAARDAAQKNMNLERRGWFESVKCLLLERDLPASRISPGLYFNGMTK